MKFGLVNNNTSKSSKKNIQKRYNSTEIYSPENESLKVNKKINMTAVGNNSNTKNKKSSSLKKNEKINNLKNNSFITCEVKNKKYLSIKEQILDEKIRELSDEILKFREERNKVNNLKKDYEKLQEQLLKDIDDFTKKKEEFEKFKQNEINNLNKEKKNLLLDSKLIINKSLELEIKKNEEIIAQLKMQIDELQLIIKNKDIEIKNLQKNVNEKNINRKNDNDKNKNVSIVSKKNSSHKKLIDIDKINDICNSSAIKFRKINIITSNKNISSITTSSKNNFLEYKNTSCLFNKTKYNKDTKINDLYSSNILNEDNNKLSFSNSNIFNNKTSIGFNKAHDNKTRNNNYNNINFKSESKNNKSNISNISINHKNNTKIDAFKSIKNNYSINNNTINNNNYTINNYQNKMTVNTNNAKSHNFFNPIQCNLKKKFKNEIKIKNEFIHKKTSQKKFNTLGTNISISKLDIDKTNNSFIQKSNKSNKSKNNNFEKNTSYDFIIPEKYIEIDKNNKINKILNIDGNNVTIYANNKKEIRYPDGTRQIIYDDNHQIIYYVNGDKKQIFNNGKIIFYNHKEQIIETLYDNGIKIVKYKNGEIQKFLCDEKENLKIQNISEFDLNSLMNKTTENNIDLNKKIGKKFTYNNNKYKTNIIK
jgi:hypothetical protein